MRKLILFLLICISAKVNAQVYQEMPQYGYRANRMAFDSTLQIPTVCGVPTLKSIVKTNKNGAIAYDSCNARFYAYNPKTLTWTAVSGGGGGATDTTSLSNRINQRIDSIRRSGDSIFARKNGVFVFQYKDSVGGGGISGTGSQYYVPKFSSTTTLQNSQIFDSVNVGIGTTSPAYKLDVNGTGRFINSITALSDRHTFGNLEINTSSNVGGASGSGIRVENGDATFELKGSPKALNSMFEFSPYVNDTFKINLTNSDNSIIKVNGGFRDPNILNLSGNTLWLTPDYNFMRNLQSGTKVRGIYYNPNIDSLSNATHIAFESTSGNVIMKKIKTSNSTTDSIAIWINDTLSKAPYPSGNNSSDTAKVVIAQVHNETATTLLAGEVVYLFGSSGNVASVKRANNKQDATSSKTLGLVRRDIPAGQNGFITTQGQIEKLNLGSYVEGDVLWLDSLDGQFTKVKPQAPFHGVFLGVVERANNGNGLAYIKPQNGVELDEVHDVQINNILNNQIIVYSDTNKVWKNRNIYSIVDTASLSNRINLKLNKTDTASLSIRINEKLTIGDTTVFQRKSIQPYSFLANNTPATTNVQALPFKDTSGIYTGSIAWNGTAPTGGNLSYRWVRIGKMVSLNISLVYATTGTSNSQVVVQLPADAPRPTKPIGLTAGSNMLYPILVNSNTTNQNTLSAAGSIRGMMRNNSANTDFEFLINYVGQSSINLFITCTYFTD